MQATTHRLATLGDFVFRDLNRNGTQDAGEPGIEGITVTLYDSTGTSIGTTTTDSTGKYEFPDLQPGTYSLGFPTTAPGDLVLTTADQGANTTDSDANVTTGRTAPIIVGAGQTDLSWDAGYVNPLGSIGNRVWNDLDKDGIQDPNEPGIEGVVVTLLDGNGNPIGTTTTDGTGSFIFPDLPPGDYALKFPPTLPNGDVLSPTGAGTPATDSDPNATTGITPKITLAPGQNNTDLDAGYYSPLASVSDFVWLDIDYDGQQDAGEPGIQGVASHLAQQHRSRHRHHHHGRCWSLQLRQSPARNLCDQGRSRPSLATPL